MYNLKSKIENNISRIMDRILIVEDEQGIRDTLQEVLEYAGYEVLIACDGKEGYNKIVDHKPDLVLCDVSMPELGGFELLESVNQRFKDGVVPPFLFLTAKVEMEELRYGMSLGADDYIFKPFSVNEVLKTVKLRIEKRKKLHTINLDNKVDFDKLALPSDDGLDLIPFETIIKCQADRAYCNFYLVDGSKVLVSKPMKEFEAVLLEKGFLKVHKSTIVNLSHIKKFVRGKAGYLLMSDGTMVNISIRKKEELLHFLKSKD